MKKLKNWILVAVALSLAACGSKTSESDTEVEENTGFSKRPFEPMLDGEWIGNGISYGAYRDGEGPGEGLTSKENILEDLEILVLDLEAIIESLNPSLRGWFEYYKHSLWNTFPPLDGWIRMRLRSILRRRKKRKGRGRGRDHQRWPNAFFAERGLFSLVAAHREACQSSRR